MNFDIIFVAGVHGVDKGYLTKKIEKTMIENQKKQLEQKLWNIANERSDSMSSAGRYSIYSGCKAVAFT